MARTWSLSTIQSLLMEKAFVVFFGFEPEMVGADEFIELWWYFLFHLTNNQSKFVREFHQLRKNRFFD